MDTASYPLLSTEAKYLTSVHAGSPALTGILFEGVFRMAAAITVTDPRK